jgi:hypothetical protein
MLLLTAKGATNFPNLRYHNNIQHPTFKEACRSRGLLADDSEWYEAFDEAATWGTSSQLRNLFVTMILFCEVGDERAFFEREWRHLADDIQYRYRQTIGDISYRIPDTQLKDYLLDELAVLFGNSGRRGAVLPPLYLRINLSMKNYHTAPQTLLVHQTYYRLLILVSSMLSLP